jgi:hypothetical protein
LGFSKRQPESTSLGWPLEKIVQPVMIDTICYQSDDLVVATFVTQVTAGPLTHRGKEDSFKTYRLHALFVDTRSGQVKATREWPSTTSESRVLTGTNGKFVVLVPDNLILYSPQMEIFKKLDISLGKCEKWEIHTSPEGKALLVTCLPSRHELVAAYQWIDTEHMNVLREWTVHGKDMAYIDAISSREMLAGNAIRDLDGPWRKLDSPAYVSYFGAHEFLNDNTIFSFRETGETHFFSLIRTDGRLLYRQAVPVSEGFSYGSVHQPEGARPSADGNRFALPFYRAHGGSAFLDIPAHYLLKELKVYDLPSQRWIFRLDGKKQKIRTLSGLALSPDGSLLALINQDGILEVYRVPSTPNSSH